MVESYEELQEYVRRCYEYGRLCLLPVSATAGRKGTRTSARGPINVGTPAPAPDTSGRGSCP